MSDKYIFIAYPIQTANERAWAVDYLVRAPDVSVGTWKDSPALGILDLLPEVIKPNGCVEYELPPEGRIYTFAAAELGAQWHVSLSIDGIEYSSAISDAPDLAIIELANRLFEQEARDGNY